MLLLTFMVSAFSGTVRKGYAFQEAETAQNPDQRSSKCFKKHLPAASVEQQDGVQRVHSASDSQTQQNSQTAAPSSCNNTAQFMVEPTLILPSPESPVDLRTGLTALLSSQLCIFSEPEPPRSAWLLLQRSQQSTTGQIVDLIARSVMTLSMMRPHVHPV